MLLDSYAFMFVFLPIALVGFFLLSRSRLTSIAAGRLVRASSVFYVLVLEPDICAVSRGFNRNQLSF